MRDEGMNCKSCGNPMEYGELYCGRCGNPYTQKNNNNDVTLLLGFGKIGVIVFSVIICLVFSVILFPIGLLFWIVPFGMYSQWFGSKSKLKECRCCHKQISKEALECPKCGCPHPT